MSDLLGSKHINEDEVEQVLAKLSDPLAFYDEHKNIRKYPVLSYDHEGKPIAISHWQTRYCAPKNMSLAEAQAKQLDFLDESRGWIRRGVKPEKDYSETK